MFGKKTLTVEINGVKNKLTAEQVKAIVDKFHDVSAQLDEVSQRAFLLAAENKVTEARLDKANAKLKEYGHVGDF